MKKKKVVSLLLAACFMACAVQCTGIITKAEEATVTPSEYKTGDENPDNFAKHSISIPMGQEKAVVPIKVNSSGKIMFDYVVDQIDRAVEIELYSNKAGTSKIGSTAYMASYNLEDSKAIYLPKGGTYYLIATTDANSQVESKISFKASFKSSADKTLTAKKWSAIGVDTSSSRKNVYRKVKVSKTGYITVETKSEEKQSYYVTLCNSKKNAISEESYQSSKGNNKTYFAVKKGTYYVRLRPYYDFQVRYSFTAKSDKIGNTAKKATTIKRGGASKSGLVFYEDSTSKKDYLKFYNSKRRKVTITLSGHVENRIKLTVVPAGDVILFGDTVSLYSGEKSRGLMYKNLPKGTYYLKISKENKKNGGNYSVKVK